MKKGVAISIILIGLLIFGFITLIRSCLAAYDEYSQFDEAQWFNTPEGKIIVYLKKYYKVSSYSSEGGMTNIGGNTYYFLETRDAATLALIKKTRFDKIDDYTRNIPHVIGRNDKSIWVFHDSIIAYNPYNHDVICSNAKLGQINPEFVDNIPNENRYISFDYKTSKVIIMLKNGVKYCVDPVTFRAEKFLEPLAETAEISGLNSLMQELENKIKTIKIYNDRRILYDSVNIIRDSIRVLKEINENSEKKYKEVQEILTRGVNGYRQLTFSGVKHKNSVFAFMSDKELTQNNGYLYFNTCNYEDALRQLYTAPITKDLVSYVQTDKYNPLNISLINPGFLYNKDNLKAIELYEPFSWLIISSKEIGDKSLKIIQRVDETGKSLWTKEIPILDFTEMLFNGTNLVLFTSDGVNITGSSDCNWMISIDVNTGEYIFLDLLTDKER